MPSIYDEIMNEILKSDSIVHTDKSVENLVLVTLPQKTGVCLTMALSYLNSCDDKIKFIWTLSWHCTITCQLIPSVA
jgi:hypothetical protein